MKRPITPLSVLVLTSIFLFACSIVSPPGTAPTEARPVFTPETVETTEPPTESSSGLENENLLVEIPDGFKIDYQVKQDNMVINEMVAQNESVNDWTTMVTAQIFLGTTDTTPEQYQATMTQSWSDACQGSESYLVADGAENGYNFVLWQLSCPLNPATQKVEFAYMKAMQGNDSFYLVQVAFRHEPSDKEITQWIQYLKRVQVCDSRLPDQACP